MIYASLRVFGRSLSLLTIAVASIGMLVFPAADAAPLALYSSNTEPSSISDTASATTWLAKEFITYGYEAQVDSVVMNFAETPSDLSSAALQLDLYSSASGLPDAPLARFTNPGSGVGTLYTFTLASTQTLSANASYWIVLSMTGGNTATWNGTLSQPLGVSNPANPTQLDPQSSNWVNGTFSGQIVWGTPSSDGPYQMDIYVQAVPEPSTWAMLIAGGSWSGLAAVRRTLRRRGNSSAGTNHAVAV